MAETIGSFVEEAARADADPTAVQAASLAYLQAAENAVAEMGSDGRVVLMAEAVLAGAAEDATPEGFQARPVMTPSEWVALQLICS